MRVLLVEDEVEMAKVVAKGLREASYAVDIAPDGGQAIYHAEVNTYDLAILDVNLPVKDGFSVCRELRKSAFTAPILILSALDDPEDIICGLNCGADDYISKPFDFPILLARIRALLRRAQQPAARTLRKGDLVLNALNHSACRAGQNIRLTSKEFALLELFMQHPGQLIARATIADRIWDNEFDHNSNIIDVYINRLRKKMDYGFESQMIQTRRSEGYVFN